MRGMLGVHTPQRRLRKRSGNNTIRSKKEPTKSHPGILVHKERMKYIKHCIPRVSQFSKNIR